MGAQEIGLPLPWVLGPMFGVGFLSMTGVAGRQPIVLRNTGQVSLGLALGLYFSPAVIAASRRKVSKMFPTEIPRPPKATLAGKLTL